MARRRRPTGLRYLKILGVVALALVSIGGTWADTGSWGLTAGAALALVALRWCGRHADAVLGVHGLLCAVQIIVTDSVLPADLPMTVSLYAVGRRGRRELTPLWTAAVVIGAALGSWDWSRDKLGFPTYYGGNLSALADCLEELAAPTRITLEQDGSRRGDGSWFDRARAVIERSGIQNPTLEVVIHA